MATANLRVVRAENEPVVSVHIDEPLHRIQEVRKEQGISLRTAARRLGTDVRNVRAQELETSDLRISQLNQWHQLLDVPMEDLLAEPGIPLSRPVMERAQMVRVMKTAVSILENAPSDSIQRFAQMLVEQLTDVMPELKEVAAWHSVGQRRSLDEYGKIAERTIPDSFLGNSQVGFE